MKILYRSTIFAVAGFLSVLSCSCGGGGKTASLFTDTLYMPVFADGFSVFGCGESSVLSVRNPWQGAENVDMNLFLRRAGEQPPKDFEGAVVDVPLKKVVCMSSSYVAFISALGEEETIKGVSGVSYITNGNVRGRFAKGLLRDVGYDSNMNYEVLAELRPDLVFLYGVYGDNSAMTRKLDELGIKYIYIGDYVEQSPLGKAEWLVAFGEMFDRREQAADIFDSVRYNYERLCDDVRARTVILSSAKPKVMLNAPYRDTWFVPGDRSYMVRLIRDAQGEYACAGVDSQQSRPISVESAYIFANSSDVWLNPGQASTKVDLLAENPRFGEIPPVVNGRVFNCNKRGTSEGGSDFWESGAVRPDIVLKDMVKIFYPWMYPDYEPYYFNKVE